MLDDLTFFNAPLIAWDLLQNFMNGGNLEFKGGLKIEIVKDSFWEGTDLLVDVSIIKGIGYEDIDTQGIEYLWIGEFNFSDVPQDFEFQVMLSTISLYLGDAPGELLEYLTTMLLSLINPPEDPEDLPLYEFASFSPPYTVNFDMDKDGDNPDVLDNDSIARLEFLLGYDKLQRVGEGHRVVDRTYIKCEVTPDEGLSVIPKNFHVKLHGKKNPVSERTDYDAVEWYSREPVNVSVVYSEGKLNDTYIVVDVEHMPSGRLSPEILMDETDYSSLRVRLENLSTEDENFTRIHYESTEEISMVELQAFEYNRGYETGNQYNGTYALVRDIPAEILIEGNFVLEEADDPFTVFNNASLSFLNGLIDDAMLALASSLYAIGIELRSIPDSLSKGISSEGEILMEMKDEDGIQDYLGSAELAIAYGYVYPDPAYHGRYATTTIPNHDYLMTYIDDPMGFSGVPDKVAVSARFSGIGMVRYEGIEDDQGEISELTVDMLTNTTFYDDDEGFKPYAYDEFSGDMPKMEVFYLTGVGDDFQGNDYARVAISNLPNLITIKLRENITIYDASESVLGNRLINYICYESLIEGQYMEFNVTHIPSYLQFINNDTILSISTIHFPEGASDTEKWKEKYYTNEQDHMNLEFLITNETRDGKIIKRSMPSNYAIIFKNEDLTTLNGSKGVAAISGRFKGLKHIYYESDDVNERIEVELRIENPGQEDLAVRLLDNSSYPDSLTDGLRGSAIIGPIPEYIHITAQKPESQRSVKEPDTSEIDGFADIKPLMDSVKEFGRSIVDVMMVTIDDTLKGMGMADSVDYWVEFSLKDPILGTRSNMDVIANITRGRISNMYDDHPEYTRSYWTRGLSMRQDITNKEEEEAIFDLKAFLTGLPSWGRMAWNATGDDLSFETQMTDFVPKSDWVVMDAKGIGDSDILVYATGLPSSMEVEFAYDSTINATEGTVDISIQSTITSYEQPANMGEFFMAVWSNASDFTRSRIALPMVPSSVDLALNMNNSLKMDYTGSEGMDFMLMDVKIGDISQLEEAYWTHGTVLRNGTDENDDRIMDMRMYMEGIPDQANIDIRQEGDDVHLFMDIRNWGPETDWVLMDIKGLNDTDLLLYQNLGGTAPVDMKLTMDLTAPETGDELLLHAVYRASRDLGGMYLKIRAYGVKYPVIATLYLPEVPRELSADIRILQGIFAEYTASTRIDHLFLRIHKMVEGEWYTLTLMLHDLPKFIEAQLGQNTDFDPEKSVILQGNPNIKLKCSEDGMDVYLDMDGQVNGAYGHTFLQVGDLTNNTNIILTEPDVYSISSPGGIEYVYLVISDLPIMESFTMEELYIYAEDVKSVDINIRQLFGLYPVFKLSNADGGRIHVKLKMEVGTGDRMIALEAGILDVKYRTLPLFAPLFVNHISTTLSTNHYMIPEPMTTVIATLLAILRGVGG